MRLLIITQKVDKNDSNLGFFHRWIEEFAKHCSRVEVICLGKGEYKLPLNVNVHSLGKEVDSGRVLRLLRFLRLINSLSYDAVFVHMNPEYVIAGGIIWKMLGKKVALWYTHKNVDLKLRLAEKLASVVLSASKESFRLGSNKLIITGHGIDTDFFCPDPAVEKEKIVLTVGRITASKHIQEIIDSIPAGYELQIAGIPVTEEDEIYRRSLKGSATFLGAVKYEDLPELYRRASLFINKSSTGSMDKAVLEALACGTKIETTNEAYAKMPDNDGREWVIENHSLSKLIPKIVSVLGSKQV
jgi:glycosyltransferase involved in cell wall biosynthesis